MYSNYGIKCHRIDKFMFIYARQKHNYVSHFKRDITGLILTLYISIVYPFTRLKYDSVLLHIKKYQYVNTCRNLLQELSPRALLK